MKESLYKRYLQDVKGILKDLGIDKTINYYQYMIDNNKESNTYPKELREFHKGLIIGLKGAKELKQINKEKE